MILDRFRLNGKVALVTGAKRGIGRAIAVGLAEAGADVIGVSASLEPEGSEVGREITALGRRFTPYRCDLGNRSELYHLLDQLRENHPRIDILVNNAGTILRAPIVEHGDELWDRVIETNLSSSFILTRELGKAMVHRGSGKIIFIASLLSFQGGITVPGYAASKGAIARLVQAFANEWAASGVHVNGIAPGYVATDNTQAIRDHPQRAQSILERIPQGRWGEPTDFAGPAVFLASEASNYMNGSLLVVDGGWMGR